ncbi:enoyl-CoA hydratase [Bradyrhizobium manausense]|uniref:enoyl-CoA hydratase n=1 Tax=Bradyrhizobium manausense TaxID=989370 RepID=UPI001BA7E207|nr:enoyl-CoA hydratase [Bradyrhizobium manausense]MBR0828606.1 enoyl-CoA hydratase [Bradyrhizobium manausense]
MAYQTIRSETRGRTLLLTLNRPEALNAINTQMASEVIAACQEADGRSDVGCIVITGSPKAFAAGADIKEMSDRTAGEMYASDWFGQWEKFSAVRKPIIAAVSGHALGGGCELAMMCDFILAADNAKFGQPEIKLGVIPGMGGSQRLARFIGKAKATEMCLTGRTMDAHEAERCGLVSRIIPKDELVEEALKVAATISSMSLPSVLMLKEAMNRAFELPLAEGVLFERRMFHSLFATADQKEGMAAFLEKRPAHFKHA